MKLEADARIPFPRQLTFETYRDRLPELVPHLPDIKAITVNSRVDDADGQPGITKLVNLWEASTEIPKVLQSVIKPEMLAWDDYATWNANEHTVDWRIETHMFKDNVRCRGHNTFVEEDGGTLFKIRGDLEVDLKGVPGVPRFLAGTIAPQVEKLIVNLLKPNLLSVAKGLTAFLESESRAP